MEPSLWGNIKHFKPSENWGDQALLEYRLVQSLDWFADYIKSQTPEARVIIHCAADHNGHSPGSQHYEGRAADLHVEGIMATDAWHIARKFPYFGGIGYYPLWSPKPGLHLDVRTLELGKPRAEWIYWRTEHPVDYVEMVVAGCQERGVNCLLQEHYPELVGKFFEDKENA